MSVFFDAGKNASELLQEYEYQMPDEIKSLLRSILKLCLIGQKLEAENAALKKHCEWLEQNLNLKNTVVDDLKNELRDALERC